MRKRVRRPWQALAAVMACLAALASASWQSPESSAAGRPAHTTPTTVMGGGSPSTWPAARRAAPSLAGAYSHNLKIAFIALVQYSDWLGSHPNPNL